MIRPVHPKNYLGDPCIDCGSFTLMHRLMYLSAINAITISTLCDTCGSYHASC